MSVRETIKELIGKNIKGVDVSTITNEHTLEDLGADSLDSVEIVLAIEHEFGLEIEDDEFDELQNFGKLVEYVEDMSQ
jgi:acyl carrier protein